MLRVCDALSVSIDGCTVLSDRRFRPSLRKCGGVTLRADVTGSLCYQLPPAITALWLGERVVLRFAPCSSWKCTTPPPPRFHITMRNATIYNLPSNIAGGCVTIHGKRTPVRIMDDSNCISFQPCVELRYCAPGSLIYFNAPCVMNPASWRVPVHYSLTLLETAGPARRSPSWRGAALAPAPRSLHPDILAQADSVQQALFLLLTRSQRPVTDETNPDPLSAARAALTERVERLLRLHAIKGALHAAQCDLGAWLAAARPQLVARIEPAHLEPLLAHACSLLAPVRRLPHTRPPGPMPVGDEPTCALCCEYAPDRTVCTQCRSGRVCEQCLDRLVLESNAACPFCRSELQSMH
jgi:hypothetical protein